VKEEAERKKRRKEKKNSSLVDPDILLSTPLSNTLSSCSSV
jgi:hypothetical protein